MSMAKIVVTKERVPIQKVRVRMSKKARLNARWKGRDRFGIAKAMGQIQ